MFINNLKKVFRHYFALNKVIRTLDTSLLLYYLRTFSYCNFSLIVFSFYFISFHFNLTFYTCVLNLFFYSFIVNNFVILIPLLFLYNFILFHTFSFNIPLYFYPFFYHSFILYIIHS